MKKFYTIFICFIALIGFAACDKNETYADQLERERDAINDYLIRKKIKVISEEQFNKQGNKTNIAHNEYVFFKNNGVYMQIVNEGVGEQIKDGETATVLCRFEEFNILRDTLQLTNNTIMTSHIVDILSVTNKSGTFEGSLEPSSSMLFNAYNETRVPKGLLVPFPYIKIGRIKKADDALAHVRLIIPSSQSHKDAEQKVYPSHFDITYGRGM